MHLLFSIFTFPKTSRTRVSILIIFYESSLTTVRDSISKLLVMVCYQWMKNEICLSKRKMIKITKQIFGFVYSLLRFNYYEKSTYYVFVLRSSVDLFYFITFQSFW